MASETIDRPTGISVKTLTISALASLLTAVIVSLFWERGTLLATAITPVIVALVSEGLARPANKLEEAASSVVVKPSWPEGTKEGSETASVERTTEAETESAVPEDEANSPAGNKRSRRAILIAVITGLLAFAIAAFILTGTELVTGSSLGTSGRTTLFSDSGNSTKQDEDKSQSGQDTDTSKDEQDGASEGGANDGDSTVTPDETPEPVPPDGAPEDPLPNEAPPDEPQESTPDDANQTPAPSESATSP